MMGRAMVQQLLDMGGKVRNLDIEPAKDDRAEMMVGDIRDAATVRKACEGVDTVFHTAVANWEASTPRNIYEEVNVKGTQIIIDTCLQLGIPRLVYASTIDVVADGKTAFALADESVPYPADVRKMNAYAYTKMVGELAILKANGPKLSTCSLRLAGMYGPGDKCHLPNVIKNAKSGLNIRVGNGKAQFSHLFSGNGAHSLIAAAEHLRPDSPVAGQTYFVTDYDTGNFFDFMNLFLEKLGIPTPKISIPYTVAYPLAWVVERLSKTSNFNTFALYCTCKDQTFVHDKATRDFGYQPIFTLEEAVNITMEWLKTQEF